MKTKDKYAGLDDVGFIGIQRNDNALDAKYHAIKTADVFKQARSKKALSVPKPHKKAS